MSLILASLMVAAPSGYATTPIVHAAACNRAKNPGSCRKCVSFKEAFFPNGTCHPMVRANEGGIANRMQCKGQKGLRLNQCKACVERRFPHRFFPHAAGAMRCRYLRGSSPRKAGVKRARRAVKPAKGVGRTPADLLTRPGQCAALPKLRKHKCQVCFSRNKGQKVGFAKKGSSTNSCRVLVASNAGGVKTPKLCQAIRKPVARKQCLRCVNNPFWSDAYFAGAGPRLRCRHVVSPARLRGKRVQPMIQTPVRLPGMKAKPKVSNAAVKAAFGNQPKPGIGAKLGIGKKVRSGVFKPAVCNKKFRHNRSIQEACRRCTNRRKPHAFHANARKGRRCARR